MGITWATNLQWVQIPARIFLGLWFSHCLTFYSLPTAPKETTAWSPKAPSQNVWFPISGDLPLEPGEKLGNLIYAPETTRYQVEIEKQRTYIPNNSPFMCLVSALTLTLIPCYVDGNENITISIRSAYNSDIVKKVQQEIRKEQYLWFPLLLLSPFLGNKVPSDGNQMAFKAAAPKLSAEANFLHSELKNKRTEIQKLLADPKKYPVLLNDFATTNLQSYSQFQFSTGKDLLIQVYNQSPKAIQHLEYKIVATNSLTPSQNDVYEAIEHAEFIPPRSFSKNILFPNRNPRAYSLFLFMERMTITWEDGSKTTIANNDLRKVTLHVPAIAIADAQSPQVGEY